MDRQFQQKRNYEISKQLSKDWGDELKGLSREPFREILRHALQAEPTVASVRRFANKYPDRYAQYVTMIAKLTGYKDTSVVEHNIYGQIQHVSDSELLAELDRLDKELEQLKGKTIEHEPDDVPALVEKPAE